MWTYEQEIQAVLVEAVDAWNRHVVSALHRLGGGKAPRFGQPLEVVHPDRPGHRRKRKRRKVSWPEALRIARRK